MNDYRQRIVIGGDERAGYGFAVVDEPRSSLDVLLGDGFAENVVERRPALERWTLYHTRGPEERHLCQLDYILLSPALARRNGDGGARHRARRPAVSHHRAARPGVASAIRASAGTGRRRRTTARSP